MLKTTNGVETKYLYGRGLIGEEKQDGFFKTYHFDYRGSTVALTDESGNITDTFAYDTYGKLIEHTGDSFVIFGYNGRDGVVTDKNGLIYMRARYYSPALRRFINADIIPGKLSNAITLNRFAYANGNPVSFVDPFGLWSLKGTWNSFTNWVSDTANDVKDWAVDTANDAKDWAVDTYNDAKDFVVDKYNDTKDWVDEKVVQPVATVVNNVKEDIQNYDKNNTDEQKVLNSHYFSSYKGKFVLNLPIGNNAFSFGIIFMGTDVPDTEYNTVKHEYGHTIQFDKMGAWNYLKDVGIPSVTGFLKKPLPYSYYTSPWEAEADLYGGVNPTDRDTSDPWTQEDGYYTFKDLVYEILH